jgi:hypothetical protein
MQRIMPEIEVYTSKKKREQKRLFIWEAGVIFM